MSQTHDPSRVRSTIRLFEESVKQALNNQGLPPEPPPKSNKPSLPSSKAPKSNENNNRNFSGEYPIIKKLNKTNGNHPQSPMDPGKRSVSVASNRPNGYYKPPSPRGNNNNLQ